MPNLVPGFVWHPIDVGNRAARRKGRGLIGHVAVSESAFLVPPGTPATRNADWHFYLPKTGPGIQFIDLDLQCWSSGAGNATCPAFESQGGVTNPQGEPWTDNQLENAARILAHLNETEGVPLQLMPNSLPSSGGMGCHRLGIDPWRVHGGEVWSSSRGKICPGDAKVAQLPEIVSRAVEIVHGSPTPSLQEEDLMLVRDNDTGTVYVLGEFSMTPIPDNPTYGAYQHAGAVPHGVPHAEILLMQAQVDRARGPLLDDVHLNVLCRTPEPNANEGDKYYKVPWLFDMMHGVDGKTDAKAIAAAVGEIQPVDEVKLATALAPLLLADPKNVDALGAAIAAHLQLAPRDA